jgi:hypothetical protein
MKRFTVFTSILSVGVLAIWAFVHTAPKSSSAVANNSAPAPVYDATGEMLKHTGDGLAVPVTGANGKIVPVYDATGAMLDAINPNKEVITVPAYDATGEMLKHTGEGLAVPVTGANGKIVPVYDATGAMLDAITP